MSFMLLIVIFAIGFAIGLFGLYSIITSIFCGLSFINLLKKHNLLLPNGNMIKNKYLFAIVFWLIIISIATLLICSFLPQVGINSYFIGIGISIFMTFNKWGKTKDNISEFVGKYYGFIDWENADNSNTQIRNHLGNFIELYNVAKTEEQGDTEHLLGLTDDVIPAKKKLVFVRMKYSKTVETHQILT